MLIFFVEEDPVVKDDDEMIGSVRIGNYLGIMELLSEYDDFFKQHILKHASCESGHICYLSSMLCEELFQLMGRTILDKIISCLKKSIYYSISLALFQARATLIS